MSHYNKIASAFLEAAKHANPALNFDGKSIEKLAVDIQSTWRPNLPERGESCAVAPQNPKTSALFFDRIWAPPVDYQDRPPDVVSFFGGSECELWMVLGAHIRDFSEFGSAEQRQESLLQAISGSQLSKYTKQIHDPSVVPRVFAEMMFKEAGIPVTPVFDTAARVENEFKPGHAESFLAVVDGIEIVDEQKLKWAQVIELRSDSEAKLKLRKMRNWLDSNFVGKPISFVSDSVAIKLDDYEWTLKKHGIETAQGALSDLLDSKLWIAASPAIGLMVANGADWAAALTGIAVVAGKVSASVTKKWLDFEDRKRGQGSEVAFVHELKKLTK